jgi:hypothetical protein
LYVLFRSMLDGHSLLCKVKAGMILFYYLENLDQC